MLTRRSFLTAAGAAPVRGDLGPRASRTGSQEDRDHRHGLDVPLARPAHGRPISRRLSPRTASGTSLPIDVVSLYVDQKPDGDLSSKRAAEHGFTVYQTIAEALRCGGDKLAVDGVVIIGEHGNYPRNKKGQILYPRYEFFQQVVQVFEKDGRAVPVYNDKHLSYSAEKAERMVAESKRLKFAFLAGSSLPVTWRLPAVEIPYDAVIEEALMVGVGGSDPMDYHALEAMQCMVERRKGGESGIKSVQLLEGDAVWKAGEEGVWSRRLLEAALSRSDSLARGIPNSTPARRIWPTTENCRGWSRIRRPT